MANPLTGDFDAIVQVSLNTLNRLLASMHQQHGNATGLPTLPHRTVMRIGDLPGRAGPNIRGTAYVQIGVPSVTFIPQTPRQTDVACWIRARYSPDPDTMPLPEFIHGKIVCRFSVEPETVAGVTGLRATASSQDAQITFSDSGLAGDDHKWVLYSLRSFLRSRVDAFLEIPADVPGGASNLLAIHDTEGRQAVTLALALRGQTAALASVTRVLTDGTDMAIGIAREYLLSFFDPAVSAIKALKGKVDVKIQGIGVTVVTYPWSVTHAEVSLTSTGFALAVKAHAHSDNVIPGVPNNINVTISQKFTLVFDPIAQSLTVVADGDPAITANHYQSTIRDSLKPKIVAKRNAALADAQPQLSKAFAQAQQLKSLLQKIDAAASMRFETFHIDVNGGIVLRGSIKLSPRKAPRVEFSELSDGSGYTAFDSWIPGGRIKEYKWMWWRFDSMGPEGPHVAGKTFGDRYLLQENLQSVPGPHSGGGGGAGSGVISTPGPLDAVGVSNVWELIPWLFDDANSGIMVPGEGQICLTVSGEHVNPVTGQMNQIQQQAVWAPYLGGCSFFKINIFHEKPPNRRLPTPYELRLNVLVYANAEQESPERHGVLGGALRQAGRSDAPLLVVLASRVEADRLPPGLAVRAYDLRRELPQGGIVFADRRNSWLRGLQLPADDSRPALRLVGAEGRLVWQHDGDADEATLASALRQHLGAAAPIRITLERAGVRPGDIAPDFWFETDGRRVALRRFRGRPLALVFAPSEPEAFRTMASGLAGRIPQGTDGARAVVLVVSRALSPIAGPGLNAGRVESLAIADPDDQIARRYGIRVRPTVVLVDRDLQITTVQTMLARRAAPPR